MLLTCALVGWVAMAPGAAARQPTEAMGPAAGVAPAGVDVRNARVASSPTLTGLGDQPGLGSVLGPIRQVTLSNYPSRPAESKQSSVAAPFRTVPSISLSLAPAPGAALSASAIGEAATGEPTIGASFGGMDDTDSGFVPPDPQVAAGPNNVMEMVNNAGRVFNKTGSNLQNFSLHDFFGIPAGWGESDPKVIYDSLSGRWFASYLAFNNLFETRVYLAVSSSNDPTGGWCTSYVAGSGLAPVADQPAIGITNDKFTFSVNFFSSNVYIGEQTVVMQKSDWLACNSTLGINTFPLQPAPWGTTRPAHSLSSINDQFLAEFDWGFANQLCIDRITGTPNAGDVARTTTCMTVATQETPPDAAQLGGPDLIHTNDNRVLDAEWSNGKLWVSANDGCDWGSGNIKSCMHLTEVDTGSMNVTQDIVWGSPGAYWFYPAISLDSAGNLYVVYSISGSTFYGSAGVTGRQLGDAANSLRPGSELKAGETYYTEQRWGDYLGAAADPTSPGCVWVVGEYAKNTGGSNWGTQIADVSFSAGCPGQATPTPAATPTHSATPTPTHSPTPTPTHSPTPTPTGSIWGDLNCTDGVGITDVMLGLEIVAGVLSSLPCSASADVDCNGVVNGLDVLDLLRFVDHLPSLVTGNCRAIGSA